MSWSDDVQKEATGTGSPVEVESGLKLDDPGTAGLIILQGFGRGIRKPITQAMLSSSSGHPLTVASKC